MHFQTKTYGDYQTNESYTLKLYDIQGRVKRIITGIDTNKVSTYKKNLKPGLYFFQILTKQKIAASGKLMVK